MESEIGVKKKCSIQSWETPNGLNREGLPDSVLSLSNIKKEIFKT